MKGAIMKIEINKPVAVETTCYGHKDKWESKEKAIGYFSECAMCSEGSERERYMNIILQLLNGQIKCSDGWR